MATSCFGAGAVAALNTAMKNNASIFNGTGTGGVTLSLFVNNHTPSAGDTISQYQAPTTSLSPATQTLTSQTFIEGVNALGQNVNLFSSEATFSVVATATAGIETSYGWYLASVGGTPSLIYAKTFDVPQVLANVGQIVSFVIQPSLSNNIGGN
jgi:hypothetical protein